MSAVNERHADESRVIGAGRAGVEPAHSKLTVSCTTCYATCQGSILLPVYQGSTRRLESNQRPSGYEPAKLPLLYSALVPDPGTAPGRPHRNVVYSDADLFSRLIRLVAPRKFPAVGPRRESLQYSAIPVLSPNSELHRGAFAYEASALLSELLGQIGSLSSLSAGARKLAGKIIRTEFPRHRHRSDPGGLRRGWTSSCHRRTRAGCRRSRCGSASHRPCRRSTYESHLRPGSADPW